MLIEKTLQQPGERLRRARMLAGVMTRRAFEKKYHVSVNTLQGWEQGKNPLSKKGAKRIVEALKCEGLICSIEWLIDGVGVPPRAFEMNATLISTGIDLEAAFLQINLQEEQAIYQELQTFKSHNPNPIIITVADDAMQPQFYCGDYVGGIRFTKHEEIQKYLGTACIIELADHTILPRYLHVGNEAETYTLSCTNFQSKNAPLTLFNTQVMSVAPIVWHRKKLFR
jgi:transcriptional regulator with XRE-family HTH domain